MSGLPRARSASRFPAAMGAWAATQDSRTRAFARPQSSLRVSGDGGTRTIHGRAHDTAVKYEMDVTHVLLNNSELGKISKEQAAGEWPVWQTELVNPNFAEYVTSCGGLGIRVTDAAELDAALERALAHDGPATVEVMTDVELV